MLVPTFDPAGWNNARNFGDSYIMSEWKGYRAGRMLTELENHRADR